MSGIGCGIGVGLGGSRRMTPAGLAAALSSIYGAALIGLWIGDDWVVSGSAVTSIVHRVGVTLSRSGAKDAQTVTIGGRRGLVDASGSANGYTNATGVGVAIKNTVMVAAPPPVIPITNWSQASYNATDGHVLALGGGTANLYTATGWTHSVDGVATEACPVDSTLHIFESRKSAATSAVFSIGPVVVTTQFWRGAIMCARALSSDPTAQQRAAELAVLKAYYEIA